MFRNSTNLLRACNALRSPKAEHCLAIENTEYTQNFTLRNTFNEGNGQYSDTTIASMRRRFYPLDFFCHLCLVFGAKERTDFGQHSIHNLFERCGNKLEAPRFRNR